MTDRELYAACKKWGYASLEARRRFVGLLPEVERRQLWRLKGYSSIHHFAAVLAGVSAAQVDEVLRVEKRIVDRPALHDALVSGEIGVSKLARIATITTVENQKEMVGVARVLSRAAINTMIRDTKTGPMVETDSDTCQYTVKGEVAAELQAMENKGIDVHAELAEWLKERRYKIEKEKQEAKPTKTVTPKTRRNLRKEFGTKCAKCEQKAEHVHHIQLKSKGGSNQPANLIPLCKDHHALEHVAERTTLWKCKVMP